MTQYLLGIMTIGWLLILLASSSFASHDQFGNEDPGLLGSGLLGPVTPNAYGPGIHSDATGRPFRWVPQQGGMVDPFSRVTPNAYGPGIGMDQYGRPVTPTPLWNQGFPGQPRNNIGPCIEIMGECQ